MFLISFFIYVFIFLFASSLLALIIILYCIVHISTSYDKQADDNQQIIFLQNHSAL